MTQEHSFSLKNFEGPLDLLLHLVKNKRLNIHEIDLLELATQYLEFIKKVQEIDYDIASEYMVMAASLLLLKTRIIVEDPKEKEKIRAEKQRLLSQLVEYQQFKRIKEALQTNELVRQNMFTKDPENTEAFEREVDPSLLTGHTHVVQLVKAVRLMLERSFSTILGKTTIDLTNISTEDRIEEVRKMFKDKMELDFETLFSVEDIKHFVVTFLALLDMSKSQEIIIDQVKPFGDIKFRIRKDVKNEK